MGKIAVLPAAAGTITTRILARGAGWFVEDVVCTSGPRAPRFEEQHKDTSISVVTSGTFQYRSPLGEVLLTPGSLLLGNARECYECGHEHGVGDRCVAFHYAPDLLEEIARGTDAPARALRFRAPRMPPLRELTPLIARCYAGLDGAADLAWEELSVQLAARTLQLAGGISPGRRRVTRRALAGVSDAVRSIDCDPGARHTLAAMSRDAEMSPYHFLRIFERVTGVTPHQYVLRARLRHAARRLTSESRRVIDVALDSGFGDVSNFNRAFREEFGVAPRTYRANARPTSLR